MFLGADDQDNVAGLETVKAALQFHEEIKHLDQVIADKRKGFFAEDEELCELLDNRAWYQSRLTECFNKGLDIDPEDLDGLKGFLSLAEDKASERGTENFNIYGPDKAQTKAGNSSASGRILNLVVCGPGGVGKSAITVMFTSGHFIEEYDPTIEDNFRKQINVDNEPVVLEILDTAGQEEYKRMREMWMRPASGFLLVYSVDSLIAYQTLYEWHDQVLRIKDEDSFPMILIGNKCDLPPQERTVTLKQGQELASKWNIPFLETSAKNHHNVDQAFHELVRTVRKYSIPPPTSPGKGTNGKTGLSGSGRFLAKKCTLF